jgi:salicylate 1-O-methyltransferase
MGAAVKALRARTDLPVMVVHTDLPGNDFSAMFEVLANDPSSYVVVDGNAYALAAGRSFYDEILSPGSVSLGWSSITTHWLSTKPLPVPGHFTAQAGGDETVRRAFAEQAARDWEGFVAARAAELAVGSRLVMVEPAAHPDGQLGSEPMMALMDQVLGELVAEGRVTAAAAAEATLPMWMRTPDEYRAAVDAHPDLDLVELELVTGQKSPLWAAFERDGDASAYADASVASMRAWSEAMLAEGIDDPATRDVFYERCRALGAEDPDRLHIQTFHVVLDIARV